MALTLYISVEDADTYFATRLYATSWTSATEANKTAALTTAQRRIDTLYFRGQKYETTNEGQEEEWPRLINDEIIEWDSTISEAVVPDAIKYATCEEALTLLQKGDPTSSPRATAQNEGVKSIKLADGTSESYDLGKTKSLKGLQSQEAYALLKPFLATTVPVR